MVRWYARELGTPSSRATTGTVSSSGGNNSSAYYYYDDDANNNYSSPTPETGSKSRELGEENAYLLLSHLVLISNVARGCPAARSAILSVQFGGEEDSTLTVLISLAVTALPPDVRGQVFGAVAELLNLDAAELEVATRIREAAGKTWELLEACQILPIHRLEQYASSTQSSSSSDSTITGLAFPPSSTALVSSSVSQLCCWCWCFLAESLIHPFLSFSFAGGVQCRRQVLDTTGSALCDPLRNGTH
jgi:hypothetical protein